MKIRIRQKKQRMGLWLRLLLISAAVLLCMGILLLAVFRNISIGQIFKNKTTPAQLEGPYPVTYIYDGDTIAVLKDNNEIAVRLIGIDAPESVNHDQSKNTPEGLEVSLWLHDQLNGCKVWLEYDEQRTDRYGRDLAYVWLDEGKTMLEEELIRNGMALTLSIEPNTRYAIRFNELEKQAKKDKSGFWGSGFFQ